MKTKIEKKYLYEGLGFPIELRNVEMLYLNNEWTPKINVKKIAKKVMMLLPFQQERFTGNQIKFIRNYFSMSLRAFAKEVLKVSHMAVSKWERFEEHSTNMDVNIEIVLRLYIYEKTILINDNKKKNEFFNVYLLIKRSDFCKRDPQITLEDAA